MSLRLVDVETGAEITEPGRPGELYIAGPTVFGRMPVCSWRSRRLSRPARQIACNTLRCLGTIELTNVVPRPISKNAPRLVTHEREGPVTCVLPTLRLRYLYHQRALRQIVRWAPPGSRRGFVTLALENHRPTMPLPRAPSTRP